MLTTTLIFLFIVILFGAAFLHGMVGFGFPLYATPLIALMIDVKSAIILTVIPNLLINTLYALSGGFKSQQMRKYWTMSLYVLVGTLIGSHALFYLNQDVLKTLLALMIIAYLLQDRFKKMEALQRWNRHWLATPIVGLFAGFLSGSVNVSSVPLVLYYLSLGLSPLVMIQVLNLSFAAGKAAQYVSLELAGAFAPYPYTTLGLLTVASLAGLALGYYFHNKFSVEGYRKLVSKVLAIIAIILVLQVIGDLFYG